MKRITNQKLSLPMISIVGAGAAAIIAGGALVVAQASNGNTAISSQLAVVNADLKLGTDHHMISDYYSVTGNGWFHASFNDPNIKVTMNGRPVSPTNATTSPSPPTEPVKAGTTQQVSVSIDHHQSSGNSDDSSQGNGSTTSNAKNTIRSNSSTSVQTHTHTNDGSSGFSSSTVTKNGKVQSSTEHHY